MRKDKKNQAAGDVPGVQDTTAPKTVFIVGGGPSLIKFDWSRLALKNVIAVNRAYEVLPNAGHIFFSSLFFWGHHKRCLLDHPATKVTTSTAVRHVSVEVYGTDRSKGLSTLQRSLCVGKSSGQAAINLATLLGATRIVLLGFDMCTLDGRHNWHGGYAVSKTVDYAERRDALDTLSETLADRNIDVINCSKISELTCFNKKTLDEVLAE